MPDLPMPAWIAKIRDFHRNNHRPENSLVFRGLCLATCLLAVVAALQQLEWPAYGFPVLALAIVGSVFSYFNRRRPSCALKAIISAYMFWVLYTFFFDLAGETDTRVPLAKLLILLYTGHSFDMPRRKDLNYSLLVSFVLITMGAVLTTTTAFALYLCGYFVLAAATGLCSHLSLCRELSPSAADVRISCAGGLPATPVRLAWRYALAVLLLGTIACSFTPRSQSLRLQALPSSWNMRLNLPSVSKGEIINPTSGTGDSGAVARQGFDDDIVAFNATADLDKRVILSQEKVMLLRTNRWCYLRGLAFQDYDGHHWRVSNDLTELQCDDPPFHVPQSFPSDYTNRTVQIIQMERDMPNLIFAAYSPISLYLPTNVMYTDGALNLRVPFLLEKGTVYSAVSQAPAHGAMSMQMMARWIRYDRHDEHYMTSYVKACQKHYKRMKLFEQQEQFKSLPACITERTKALARQITASCRNDFQRAFTLADYLRTTYTYQMVPPPYPRDREVCDYFLFQAKVGNCQQFATSLVVLARSLGLSARYVTGYAPSRYNPLTGYYEIRGCDSHAWAEICLPPVGWIEFEPTPAQGDNALPLPESSPGHPMFIQQLVEFLGSFLTAEQLEGMHSLYQLLLDALNTLWRPAVALALALGLFRIAHILRLWSRRRWQSSADSGNWDRVALGLHRFRGWTRRLSWPSRQSAEQAADGNYRELLILLQQRGWIRPANCTLRQFARQVAHELPLPELETINELWERRHYGGLNDPRELERFCSLVQAATEHLKTKRKDS